MDTFGARVRSARRARGMSQWQLAVAAGTREATIGRIERGQGTTLATALKVSEALDLPLGDLVDARSTGP